MASGHPRRQPRSEPTGSRPGGIPRANGIRTSLLQKAENAQAQVERGNNTAARNLLDAFIHEVGSQAGIHIAVADAQRLIDLATRLRDGL